MLDEAPHTRVPELRLRLTLELRLGELHRDDRGEPLAHVFALEVLLLLLQEVHAARVLVQRARERRLEAGEVRAALVRVDVVRERVDRLDVLRVPLHRHLDLALLALALEVDDVLVDRILVLVDVGTELADPALVVELDLLAAGALVAEADPQAARQEGGLLQALAERLVRPVDFFEDLPVGQEARSS